MGSLSRKGRSRPKPQMNVTPLVDVVLVLLIIFMVVLPAMDEAVQLDLPTIDNIDAEHDDDREPFVLSVRADGTMYFEEARLPDEGFETNLREANAREPLRRLVLRGDATAEYQRIRALFAICQRIGFPGISLRVNHVDEAATAQR